MASSDSVTDESKSSLSEWVQTRRQLFLFVLIGGIQLGTDCLCFFVLTRLGTDVTHANLTSRILGAALGFWLNGRHTFGLGDYGSRQFARQVSRFAIGWGITTALSTVAVWAVDRYIGLAQAQAAKLLIDASLALLGFALCKYWIYR